MRFSVIVPVYNVEEYLRNCIESIYPAMMPEDEIILSLGKSSDNSSEISYQLSKEFQNIKIIHQSGRGLSNARNCAIQAATGDYIICVDSDDYVITDLFCAFLNRIRNEKISEDVIVHDFYRFDRRTNATTPVFQVGNIPDQTDPAFLIRMLQKRQCYWNVWRYMYRREFLLEKKITFRENMLSEDVDYTTSVFLARPTVRFTHSPFYIYTVGRGDSLMDRPTLRRLSDTVDVLTDSIVRLKNSNLNHAPIMTARFQFEYILNMALTVEIEYKDHSLAEKLYRDWKYILSDSQDPVVRFITCLLHVSNLRVVSYGLHILKLIRRWIFQHATNRSEKK